ncbi:hypothetical protein CC1G_12999 [Coprinopsis cinerea okayama7|uniref:Uncharacterized protein n=1 Tax=Coprinopsis cinerea (strain Okayama-7 / 130 / ATCC MYA-4618 / FGSC 9003) TaxID=240176 RepID=A8P6W4_COPC7|nr:hypothetical protein CC1G_12999 [Coprinopsis cinerea okayama7\|eukprot:XP_001839241.1 hypothetical protein CC1G_12999 [Coprinopsis cinerea okayama7\
MALESLRGLLCCCRQQAEEPIHEIPDENSLLIPPNFEQNTYTDSFLDNQKIQERLGTIVRAKEGKMVNLGSHIPFNLHNRTLLPSDRTISRSNSGSLDMMGRYQSSSEQHLDDVLSRRRYLQSSYGQHHLDSRSPSPAHHDADSSRSSRFRLTVTEQPRPSPILNVRLVGYNAPTTSRGRTRERTGHSNLSTTSPQPPSPTSITEPQQPPPQTIPKKKPVVVLDDASSIVMSWGD